MRPLRDLFSQTSTCNKSQHTKKRFCCWCAAFWLVLSWASSYSWNILDNKLREKPKDNPNPNPYPNPNPNQNQNLTLTFKPQLPRPLLIGAEHKGTLRNCLRWIFTPLLKECAIMTGRMTLFNGSSLILVQLLGKAPNILLAGMQLMRKEGMQEPGPNCEPSFEHLSSKYFQSNILLPLLHPK